MSEKNQNVQKLLEFVRNNSQLVSNLYQKHFQEYGESETLLTQVPQQLILEFIKQLFGFNRQEYSDPVLKGKLDTSLKESLTAFIGETEAAGREVYLEFEVVTELLKYCIENNKAFTVEYKKKPQAEQELPLQSHKQIEDKQPQQSPQSPEYKPQQASQVVQPQAQKQSTSQNTVPKSQPQPDPAPNKSEALKRRLKIIFQFYCKQQQNVGAHATFDRISHECSVMNLGKFLMFCHGYGVTSDTLNKYVLMEKFKKTSEGMKEIDAEGFFDLFSSLVETEEGLIERINLDNDKKFKEKLKLLNIPFATRDKAIVSHFPIAASHHKLTGHSGKTSDQLMQYINERKRLKKEEARHISTPIPAVPIARIFKKKDNAAHSRSLNKYSQELSQSTNNAPVLNSSVVNNSNKQSGSLSYREPQTQRAQNKKNTYSRYEYAGNSNNSTEEPAVGVPVNQSSKQFSGTSNGNVTHSDLKNLGLDRLIIMEQQDQEWLKQYKITPSTGSQAKLIPAARPPIPPSRNESIVNDLRRRVVEVQQSQNLKQRSQQAKLDFLSDQQKKKLESIRRK